MASLVGGAVGAVIGYFIGGPQGAMYGWAIGSAVGSYVGQPNTEGPRLQDRNVQISSYGSGVPIFFGNTRVTGNVIWPQNFMVDEHSNSSSSKGGPSNTTFTYSATFAVLLGGPCAGVSRIWMNKKLVYSVTGTPSTDPSLGVWRLYTGTESQTPDPLMVARDGSAPAYRGYSYIVFESVELTNSGFGNRPPVVECEVFTNPLPSPHSPVSYRGSTYPTSSGGMMADVDTKTGWVWTVENEVNVSTFHIAVVGEVASSVILNIAQATTPTINFTPLGVTAVEGLSEVWVVGQMFADNKCHIFIFDSGTANADGSAASVPFFKTQVTINTVLYPVSIDYDKSTEQVFIAGGYNNSTVATLYAINPLGRTVTATTSSGAIGFPNQVLVGDLYVALFNSGTGAFLNVFDINSLALLHSVALPTISGAQPIVSYDSVRHLFIVPGTSMHFHLVNASTGAINTYTVSAASNADTSPVVSTAGIVASAYLRIQDMYYFGSDPNTGQGTTVFVMDPNSLTPAFTFTYENHTGTVLLIPPLLAPAIGGNPPYLLSFDDNNVKRLPLNGGTVGTSVTLDTIVATVCEMQNGLSGADIDVTQLASTSVDGFIIAQQMTRRSAIEPLQAAFFFDVVEVDHILKFVKRGRPPVADVPQDERAAISYGGSPTPALNINRISELELPWTVDVMFMDLDRDYEIGNQYDRRITRNSNNPVSINLPIVMESDRAKGIATTNLYVAWSRDNFSFETSLKYANLIPTDVVTLSTDSVTYTARITARSDSVNGILKWDATLEDISLYGQSGAVAAGTFVPQTIRDAGVTILELLDIPILRDTDNDPGFYTAVGGTTSGWKGATLYKSVDTGLSYNPTATFTNQSSIGVAQGVLGDFTAGNIVDNGNSVTVKMLCGQLTSVTQDQMLNGFNTAVIGLNGRWEVIGFMNATLISANTYTLTGLLRGRRGTEWTTGLHATSDIFVLANQLAWQRFDNGSGELGVTRLYKAPAFDTSVAAAIAQSFINTGIGLKPYAPINMTGARDGSNNLTIGWQRRSRLGYGTLNAIVPVGEVSEAYSIDIMSGSTVLRTITSSSPSVVYSAADQTTDGITPGNPVTANVYQISATVGRGYQLHAIV